MKRRTFLGAGVALATMLKEIKEDTDYDYRCTACDTEVDPPAAAMSYCSGCKGFRVVR